MGQKVVWGHALTSRKDIICEFEKIKKSDFNERVQWRAQCNLIQQGGRVTNVGNVTMCKIFWCTRRPLK